MKQELNILSLFDGMSCGMIALEKANIKVGKYYASEIDKYSQIVSSVNYPNIIRLGDVKNVDVNKLEKIDLLIGGSPCQSFSFAGKRKGMSTKCEIQITNLEQYLEFKQTGFEFEGQSYLFWEYMRILTEIKVSNPNVLFLLENVEMGKKWERVLSEAIGVFGVHINSALMSAQNRKRVYWTNIKVKEVGFFDELYSDISQPKDKGILLKDILESEVDEKYFLSDKTVATITKHGNKIISDNDNPLQSCTIHVNYFKMGGRDQQYIVHNMMPRSSTRGKGGTGHLKRNDGKTYCLDTGNTNAVEFTKNYIQWDTSGKGYKSQQDRSTYEDSKSNTIPSTRTENKMNVLLNNSRIRRLTPLECERLQTVPDNYTAHVSDSQRYKMIGNGWTVSVIAHIFSFINNN